MKKNMRVIAAAAMAAVMIAMTGCGSSGGAEETTAETTGKLSRAYPTDAKK